MAVNLNDINLLFGEESAAPAPATTGISLDDITALFGEEPAVPVAEPSIPGGQQQTYFPEIVARRPDAPTSGTAPAIGTIPQVLDPTKELSADIQQPAIPERAVPVETPVYDQPMTEAETERRAAPDVKPFHVFDPTEVSKAYKDEFGEELDRKSVV